MDISADEVKTELNLASNVLIVFLYIVEEEN